MILPAKTSKKNDFTNKNDDFTNKNDDFTGKHDNLTGKHGDLTSNNGLADRYNGDNSGGNVFQSHTLWCHQTWLAGKPWRFLAGKTKWGDFPAMFGYRKGYEELLRDMLDFTMHRI